jgi:mannose-6-phosphate isomerase
VQPGDFFYIPAGTVHAIGAGITLVEVQQYADITYRLYDYGRPRELHLVDGVAVSKATPYADARSGRAEGNMRLLDGPFFELDHVNSTSALARINGDGPFWVIPIKGETQIGGVAAGPGECLLLESLAPVVPGPNATLLVARAADY